MDSTDHSHVPFVVILVRALDDWKKSVRFSFIQARVYSWLIHILQHDDKLPKTYAERQEFKNTIIAMRRKVDEENFEEAISQAYRAHTETKVPFDVAELFSDSGLTSLSPSSPPFFHLLAALKEFSEQPPFTLPLSATLPDMHSETSGYVHLQKLYKAQAEKEKQKFVAILKARGVDAQPDMVDEFVRNAHALKIIRGRSWESFDEDKKTLGQSSESEVLAAADFGFLSGCSEL